MLKETVPLCCAGIQQVPGVYLASSTALCGSDCDADRGECSSQPAPGTSPGSTIGSSGRTGAGSMSPVRAPLMHAGRPTRLGSPVAQSAVQQQQQQGFESRGEQLVASSSKGPVLDVYGQPRVLSPPLPATYSKVGSSLRLITPCCRPQCQGRAKCCAGSMTGIALRV